MYTNWNVGSQLDPAFQLHQVIVILHSIYTKELWSYISFTPSDCDPTFHLQQCITKLL